MYQRVLCHSIAAAALACATLTAQSNSAQNPGSDLVRQGIQLDLNGQYAEARQLFARAIETAQTPQAKTAAVRAIALSYAFENDCQGAIPYEKQLYEMYLEQQDFYNAGEMANELARICLEAGAFDEAQAWYQIGRDAGLKEPGIKPDRRDLWEFRWEHAQARLAIRRGRAAEAHVHVAAAKAILDRGTNPDQAIFFPYLTGYVALYGGDYRTALAELQKANQRDPFILCLVGQTYEKLGETAKAAEYYRQALTVSNAHNPPNAYARPFARKKLR